MFRSIKVIKAVHTGLFVIGSALLAILLYQVVFDKITMLTFIVVILFFVEGIILMLSGWQCPLTVYAERLGSPHGQVTDIVLPKWIADRVFHIYGSLYVFALLLLLIRLIW